MHLVEHKVRAIEATEVAVSAQMRHLAVLYHMHKSLLCGAPYGRCLLLGLDNPRTRVRQRWEHTFEAAAASVWAPAIHVHISHIEFW